MESGCRFHWRENREKVGVYTRKGCATEEAKKNGGELLGVWGWEGDR